jgi:peptide/nickel transport system substrate-binding protein
MAAVGQEDVLKALVGDPKYYQTCAAVMGCGMPNGDNYGADWIIPSRIDQAKALLQEAKYDGTPVVILQPTDMAMVAAQPVVIGAALRKAGFNVKMKTMDWQSVIMQRNNQNSPQDGGWNIFATYSILATAGDPINNGTLSANGRKAWAGWPDVPQLEELRVKYVQTADAAERKRITAQIQKLAIDEGVIAPLGQFQVAAVYSTKLSGILTAPVTVFWNLKKADK